MARNRRPNEISAIRTLHPFTPADAEKHENDLDGGEQETDLFDRLAARGVILETDGVRVWAKEGGSLTPEELKELEPREAEFIAAVNKDRIRD